MKVWQITNLTGRSLRQVNATLEPGLHVVFALDSTGTDEFIPLLDGSTAPHRGRAELDGMCPYRSPELRRHIGSLWHEETLPTGRDLRDSLRSLAMDGTLIDATHATLVRLGLGKLGDRPIAALEPDQVRSAVLALAMSKPDLWSLLLHEPFLAVPTDASCFVAEFLLEQATRIPVVVVTSSRTTALRLGGPNAELGGGFVRRIQRKLPESHTLRVSGSNLRPLAAELVRRPRVHSLRMINHPDGGDELWLEGSDPQSVALDVARIALQTGARIWSMDTLSGAA